MPALVLCFVVLFLLTFFSRGVPANAQVGVSVSVRISNEINCETDPQTNIYFDISPVDGGEVAIDDNSVIRKFDAAGSFEEEGLSGYFGNGTYRGVLSPRSGFVLGQSSAFTFTVASLCDANGVPIVPLQSTSTPVVETPPLLPPPPPPEEPTTETVPVTTTTDLETISETTSPTETTNPESDTIAKEAAPLAVCKSAEECALLCEPGGSGANACTDFANQVLAETPLSFISTAETDDAALGTAVTLYFAERSGARAFTDSDQDGIVDFDEVNLYGTDPNKADSDKDGTPDGAELLASTDPTASTTAGAVPTAFEDPRTRGKAAEVTLIVAEIVVNATSTDASGVGHISSMTLSGRAPANSFLTLFIYSDPIVVVVKADEFGSWTYTLDKELPDGSHEVYAAVTDSGKRVLARSTPLPFVQTASAITVGSVELLPGNEGAPTFFGGSGIVTMLIFFVVIVVVVMIVLGTIGLRKEGDGTGGTPSAA